MKLIYDLLIPLILVILLTYILHNNIKKYPKYYYFGAIVLSSTSLIYELYKLLTNAKKLTGPIYILERWGFKGFIALALFIVVIFCGALNKKSNYARRILKIRGELSIIAAIFMIPHVVIYITKFIMKLFNGKTISVYNFIYIIIGLLAFFILIPLFITSLPKIKKTLSKIKWKKIQTLAYLFFGLIYFHVIFILLDSKNLDLAKFIFYNLLFLSYIVLKIINSTSRRRLTC
ncbi:MAG: ferric reductase-like transmembrane domain-containing protein [Sarcina sp.]